ncbi:MAG: hypothetical protein JSV95_08345 [Gemmatimonadota bacterium]|nr:MAG: hypothetical protein JSV95_08345 [Gemmatimonadota bacterium]
MRRRRPVARWLALPWAAAASGIAGCSKQVETGPPLADASAVGARVRAATGPAEPFRLRFDWRYVDEKGPLSGEGVARYNPRDSLRLDLFAPGDASMGVSLTPSGLATLGQIEDVRLPGPVFLYAMAGIFRPGAAPPTRGFVTDSAQALVIPAGSDSLFAFVQGSRILGLEERRGSRVRRRIEVQWDAAAAWPRSAEYRDFVESRRVRWELTEATEVLTRHAAEIYDLPHRM